jgi:hypothetical protein
MIRNERMRSTIAKPTAGPGVKVTYTRKDNAKFNVDLGTSFTLKGYKTLQSSAADAMEKSVQRFGSYDWLRYKIPISAAEKTIIMTQKAMTVC